MMTNNSFLKAGCLGATSGMAAASA